MFAFKVLCALSCLIVLASALPEDVPVLGGVKQLSEAELEEAQNVLQTSLTKLAAGDGPHYKISKVNSATSQVVSGSLFKYNVDLIDQSKQIKKCNVSIWSQAWLENGIEVTFDCEGESKLVKKHSA